MRRAMAPPMPRDATPPQPRVGTTVEAARRGEAEALSAEGASCVLERESRRFRVLLVEDDPEMRHVVAEGLRSDGYEVIELADGGPFLVSLAPPVGAEHETASIDLIVSDIRMPACTGLQLVSALRDAHWRTPVILMTAFGDEATHRQAASLDAVLFDKPFEIDDLKMAVRALLQRGREPR
jgi:DNA-binding response OmpR family regulator